MPYIKGLDRIRLDSGGQINGPGDLNYLFTRIALRYIESTDESYVIFNDIIGALEACKLEFYRRMVAQYENVKIDRNGDVYPHA